MKHRVDPLLILLASLFVASLLLSLYSIYRMASGHNQPDASPVQCDCRCIVEQQDFPLQSKPELEP